MADGQDLCFLNVDSADEGVKGAADLCATVLCEGGWLVLRARGVALREVGKYIDSFVPLVYRGAVRLRGDDAMFFWRKGVTGRGDARFF